MCSDAETINDGSRLHHSPFISAPMTMHKCLAVSSLPLKNLVRSLAISIFLSAALIACNPDSESGSNEDGVEDSELVLYSGRSESLVAPLIEQFTEETGIEVSVRWASSTEIAATLMEEGDASPADLFFAQDPGSLGQIADRFAPLPEESLERVDSRFRDQDGRWIGVSGRARVLVYSPERVKDSELPNSLEDLTDPKWKGRLGWAPGNSSFQTMVTAMRSEWGPKQTGEWIKGMVANETIAYEKNTPIVAAVGAGEIDLGLVNHYYLHRFYAEEGPDFPAKNHFLNDAGPGSLLMVAGAGILQTAKHPKNAQLFIDFLLSESAQAYFAEETYEYPLVESATDARAAGLPALSELKLLDIGLSELSDLAGSATLLQESGASP